MKKVINPEVLEAIKSAVTIEAVLDHFGISHKRSRCACPVHGGDNPSAFSFTDEVFYCHTHGCRGDVISLTQHLANVDFAGAINILSSMAGINLGDQTNRLRTAVRSQRRTMTQRDSHLEGIKIDRQFCLDTQSMFSSMLRSIRVRFALGQMEPDEFYTREIVLEHWLDELDAEEARLNYDLNQYRRRKRQ